MKWFHDHGYGNAGATSGHLIPDYPRVLNDGWKGIYADLERRASPRCRPEEQDGPKGAQLRAMLTAATMARDLAGKYAALCEELAAAESRPGPPGRAAARWPPCSAACRGSRPSTFWEAVQSLWLTHMLVMSDENYPGPGVSFGRIDQYLYPFWQRSLADGHGPGVRQGDPQVLLDPLPTPRTTP